MIMTQYVNDITYGTLYSDLFKNLLIDKNNFILKCVFFF